MKILINTLSTKKNAGGAFQIAQNFLLKTLEDKEVEWFYITSRDIDDVIGENFTFIKNKKYFVFSTQPDITTYKNVKKKVAEVEMMISPDIVYSITSPSYFSFKSPEVMRFTNPWVTHPNKFAWRVLSLKEKVYYFLYGLNQRRMMKSAHSFITQTETCAKGIKRVTGIPDNKIKVVSNVLPAVFKYIDNNHIDDDNINIACVGNTSPHKNFIIVPEVILKLNQLLNKKVFFHMTMPEGDAVTDTILNKARRIGVIDQIVNHGRVSQNELGVIYKKCTICFLPSLLEVFSASTVEAMYFGLPTIASNFEFNSEVFQDSCLYFEPSNSTDAADKIFQLLLSPEMQLTCKAKMETQLIKYGNYEEHFNEIKKFLILQAVNKV